MRVLNAPRCSFYGITTLRPLPSPILHPFQQHPTECNREGNRDEGVRRPLRRRVKQQTWLGCRHWETTHNNHNERVCECRRMKSFYVGPTALLFSSVRLSSARLLAMCLRLSQSFCPKRLRWHCRSRCRWRWRWRWLNYSAKDIKPKITICPAVN